MSLNVWVFNKIYKTLLSVPACAAHTPVACINISPSQEKVLYETLIRPLTWIPIQIKLTQIHVNALIWIARLYNPPPDVGLVLQFHYEQYYLRDKCCFVWRVCYL